MLRANNTTKPRETWSSPLVDSSFLVRDLFLAIVGGRVS